LVLYGEKYYLCCREYRTDEEKYQDESDVFEDEMGKI
jgi:hypothetical protein